MVVPIAIHHPSWAQPPLMNIISSFIACHHTHTIITLPQHTHHHPHTLQKGQLYFITDSALYELFKFANKFSEEVTDGLKEEGLTIQAASFDQIKRNMKSATHTS